MSSNAVPAPDMLVLNGLDDLEIALLRRRLKQARKRLKTIEVETSTFCHWRGRKREDAGLAHVRGGTSLTMYPTDYLSGFTFTDRTMQIFADVTGTSPLAGIAAAHELLDRFGLLLRLPRVRAEQLDFSNVASSTIHQESLTFAQNYLAKLDLMVMRWSAIYRHWGRREAPPPFLGIHPPSPTDHGDLIHPQTGRSVLTTKGAAMLCADVPRILHLSSGDHQGYVVSAPESWSRTEATSDPGAVETIRLLRSEVLRGANSRVLAPRFRR